MYVLFDFLSSAWGVIRRVFLWIDSIGLTFIDNAYDLMIDAASAFDGEKVAAIAEDIMRNCYIIIGIFALFRIAIFLVNSIINPDKFNEKGSGVGNMFVRIFVTVILLIAVPIVFELSRELQGEIIHGNYISKIILGASIMPSEPDKNDAEDIGNPGAYIKDIAVRALIHPDEQLATEVNYGQYDFDQCGENNKEGCEACNNNAECRSAVLSWNNDAGIGVLTKYISTYVEIDDDSIYAYNYTPFITLIVGGFITYVLLSFAIDIAVRSVELMVLEILAPLFIVTYIDPKSSSSGPFKNWVTTCGKTFVSLFIKIGIVCLMLLLIAQLERLFGTMQGKGFLKLLIVIAILIFAKKAPKWIGDMIGVEGGLGGLWSPKKLVEGMAAGGFIAKTARGAAGLGFGLANNLNRQRRGVSTIKKQKGLDSKSRRAEKAKYIAENGSSKGFRSAWNKKLKENGLSAKSQAAGGLASALSGAGLGFKAGVKSDKLTGALKGSIEASNQWADDQALGGKSIKDKAVGIVKKPYEKLMNTAYGSESKRLDARDAADKARKRDEMWTEEGLKNLGGMYNSNLAAGMGGFIEATTDSQGHRAVSLNDAYAMVRAKAEGLRAEYVNGKLQILKADGSRAVDSSGNAIDVTRYSDEMKNMTNDIGAAQMKDWFVKSQQSVLSEFQSTSQYIVQANQNISSITGMLNPLIQSKATSVSGASVDPNTGFINIPGVGDGETISIGANNVDSVSLDNILDQANKKLQNVVSNGTEEQKIEAIKKHSTISNFVNMLKGDPTISTYSASLVNANNDLQANLARQAQIAPAYESIGSDQGLTTYQQRVDYVTNQADKIGKEMAALEKDKKDDKK